MMKILEVIYLQRGASAFEDVRISVEKLTTLPRSFDRLWETLANEKESRLEETISEHPRRSD
jgi:hypothetical protein